MESAVVAVAVIAAGGYLLARVLKPFSSSKKGGCTHCGCSKSKSAVEKSH